MAMHSHLRKSSLPRALDRENPHAAFFFQALNILQVDAKELLHVGDSEEADLIGAKAAGIDAYLLERPSTDLWGFMDWVGKYLEIG